VIAGAVILGAVLLVWGLLGFRLAYRVLRAASPERVEAFAAKRSVLERRRAELEKNLQASGQLAEHRNAWFTAQDRIDQELCKIADEEKEL
jgi:hypothetical protein